MMLSERSVELPWLIANIGCPMRLLDIGSADGVYTGILYEMCRDLYLCDTRRFDSTVPAQVHIGSAHQLPDDWTGKFDLVTCLSVLDHVGLDAYGNTTDDDLLYAVIVEIERVLAKGGRLLLTVPFGRGQVTRHPAGGQRVFGKDELLGLFSADEWQPVQCRVWRIDSTGNYAPVRLDEAATANYDRWRAEACIALELIKL